MTTLATTLPTRDEVRAVISNSFYGARNAGRTMEDAADAAANQVMRLLAKAEADSRFVRDVGDAFRVDEPDAPINGGDLVEAVGEAFAHRTAFLMAVTR